ncbi:SDR family NAD(P)-dependent oxidoreductase [Leifsonia sp. YAF41]|uniref:SDR family NAD(P)-dependent oxidoreductase n=1 Tax=Leifsonia sp. YAF41 TaxID=3233086 RepID=UPI003F9E94B6
MDRTLQGMTIVVTGASSGLGREAAKTLAERGAEVAVVGRNPERTRAVAAEVGGQAFLADFASFGEVRALADALLERYPSITVLANNAGGLVSKRTMTEDGHELTIQSNFLSPFLLTRLLLPRLEATASAAGIDPVTDAAGHAVRVISTASVANRVGQLRLDDLDWEKRRWNGGWRAYGTAKIATILFTRELARRTRDTGIAAYSFHPGFVSTRFGADSRLMKVGALFGNGGLSITPQAGAAPLVHLATAESIPSPSGTYFDGVQPNGASSKQARDLALAGDLWAAAEKLTGVAAVR